MKRVVNYLLMATVAAEWMLAVPACKKSGRETTAIPVTWSENYTAAVSEAKKEHKMLLLNFTGSDWCSYCIKLNDNVFSKPEFARWASNIFVLVKLDFPQTRTISDEVRKQNAVLQAKYNVEGFPTIIILDANEKKLTETHGYRDEEVAKWVADRDAELSNAK